ncbi:MAG: cytochrome c oxidase subunit II [Proteobacteria bacterium]|nr:cytochrome c oxidase subunit II [Pseudomonadota bacterium]
MSLNGKIFGLAAAAWSMTFAAAANAGQPVPWQIDFQEAATPVMAQVQDFNTTISVVIVLINWFVIALLVYVMWRFNAKRNPTPSKTTHNTLIEVVWTVAPIMILIIIAVPSFRLLYFQDRAVDAEMTIKAVGNQWYWTYEYPDHGGFEFDALMIPDDEIGPGQVRLLETDNRIVVPVDTSIRLLVTAADVIHAWAVPAFGVKVDAVPGRLSETWFRIEREGVYYGQCSELCGVYHGFMPIAVEAVSKQAFTAWVERARQEFALDDARAATTVAQARTKAVQGR